MYHSRLVSLRNMFSLNKKTCESLFKYKKEIYDNNKPIGEVCMMCLSNKQCPFNENKICFPNK